MFGLKPIQLLIIGGLLAAVLVVSGIAYIFKKGESEGSATVTKAVQEKTVETLDKARETKEKADADVRATPFSERVDGLR